MEFKFGRKGYIPKRHLKPRNPVVNPYVQLYKNCRVHLVRRSGTYKVIGYTADFATITCKTWVNQYNSGNRTRTIQVIHRSDIKCLHGHDKFS